MGAGIVCRLLQCYISESLISQEAISREWPFHYNIFDYVWLQAVLDASGMGGKGGGKGDRAQGISQGVHTLEKAMVAAREFES